MVKKISCLIPAFQVAGTIEDTIRSIYNSSLPSGLSSDDLEVRVYVTEGGDDTLQIVQALCEEFPSLHYTYEKERSGKPSALNALVEQAEGELLFLMDGDVRFDRTAISEMYDALSDSSLNAVGAVLDPQETESNWFMRHYNRAFNHLSVQDQLKSGQISGRLWAVKKENMAHLPEDIILDDAYAFHMLGGRKNCRLIPSAKVQYFPPQTLREHRMRNGSLRAGDIQLSQTQGSTYDYGKRRGGRFGALIEYLREVRNLIGTALLVANTLIGNRSIDGQTKLWSSAHSSRVGSETHCNPEYSKDLSIGIVTYNSSDSICATLDALLQTIPESIDYEIIILDNNSKDGTADLIRTTYDKKVRVIESPVNVGFGAGHNEIAKVAQGRYHLVLNPDVYVHDGCIESMVEFMGEHQDVGIAVCRLYEADGATIQRNIFRKTSFPSMIANMVKNFICVHTDREREVTYFPQNPRSWFIDPQASQPLEVDWVLGAFMMFDKETYDEIGGFDSDRYFLFSEDADISHRCWHDAGKTVMYNPQATATHDLGWGQARSPKLLYHQIRSVVRYYQRIGWFPDQITTLSPIQSNEIWRLE